MRRAVGHLWADTNYNMQYVRRQLSPYLIDVAGHQQAPDYVHVVAASWAVKLSVVRIDFIQSSRECLRLWALYFVVVQAKLFGETVNLLLKHA